MPTFKAFLDAPSRSHPEAPEKENSNPEDVMRRSILLILATMMVALGSTATFAINDRNNEPICAQPGNVDPRCY
jgi:uracil-DNA glycosylase